MTGVPIRPLGNPRWAVPCQEPLTPPKGRVDWERLRQGPTAADLEDIPATTEADWQDAELLIPVDAETWAAFQEFRKQRAGA